MNNQLITISHGAPTTTTLAISEGVEMDHASVIKLVRNYQKDLEMFGLVRFEIRPRLAGQHGGGDTEYAILNERQASLLFTYMRNTDIIRKFKIRLVSGFHSMAEIINKALSHPRIAGHIRWLIRNESGRKKREKKQVLLESKPEFVTVNKTEVSEMRKKMKQNKTCFTRWATANGLNANIARAQMHRGRMRRETVIMLADQKYLPYQILWSQGYSLWGNSTKTTTKGAP